MMAAAVPPEFGPDAGGRLKGVTVVKPIIYGNVARHFGKKREEDGHTHQWTVYVKPYLNEDMSGYVKKVHFKLHDSYANPNRVHNKPPYEVTETGWGEFEIVIKIYFHDPNERPVTLYHILKLFHQGADMALSKKTLISEFYEEIVFQDPTQYMQHLLTNVQPVTMAPYKHETDFEEKKVKSYQNILTAKTKIKSEITDVKEKLKKAKEAIAKYKEEIAKAQSGSMAESPSLA
ncbi:hypothetical protein FOCC_FOCC013331 [Frankliniella occidentalis]|uniref:YEATS domain-containing protein 4 n=1 Tax=Frankliniella occidentalis TaxID=133901 RepID=A0A6J1SS35_FRAOC|nr:YEATS domain-containing protein 4 [Frankliniella occidentalis]KAE8741167.1 hypothetical protein FOCC_FOCC013331 [Frankliniella occidentalis]